MSADELPSAYRVVRFKAWMPLAKRCPFLWIRLSRRFDAGELDRSQLFDEAAAWAYRSGVTLDELTAHYEARVEQSRAVG